jgi:hypothetical protein
MALCGDVVVEREGDCAETSLPRVAVAVVVVRYVRRGRGGCKPSNLGDEEVHCVEARRRCGFVFVHVNVRACHVSSAKVVH